MLQLLIFDFLHGSHVSSASGTAWKEGHMDFTGRTNKYFCTDMSCMLPNWCNLSVV